MEQWISPILIFAALYFFLGFAFVGLLLPGLLLPKLEGKFKRTGTPKHTKFFRSHDFATALISKSAAQQKFNATPQAIKAELTVVTHALAIFYISAWYGFYLLVIPLTLLLYYKMQ